MKMSNVLQYDYDDFMDHDDDAKDHDDDAKDGRRDDGEKAP